MSAGLEAAARIAARLAGEAVWHEGRCSWIGDDPGAEPGGRVRRALGPDLYGGTAGVALVLAEVGAATQDAATTGVARGAIRHALARADPAGSDAPLGLYAGELGIALAARRVGALTGDAEAVAAARGLLGALRGRTSSRTDLIGGLAGAVVGLLAIDAAQASPELRPWAQELGDGILAAARRRTRGWSWEHPAMATTGDLTGLSHGASGIAHALHELWAATGEARFRQGAEAAMAYERSLIDATGANWADLRDLGEHPAGGRARGSSRVFWCHGAAGIALARHRAWTLTGDATTRREAALGLTATAAWVRAGLRGPATDRCLCHGLCGDAEVLRDAAAAADAAPDAMRDLADEVAGAEVGTASGIPGLMPGIAGVARFHLRAHDPSLPSLLLVRPEAGWSARSA